MTTQHPAGAGAPSASQALAKLRRIYGQAPLGRDAFGRRPALASEVARHLERRTSPAGPTAAVSGAGEVKHPR